MSSCKSDSLCPPPAVFDAVRKRDAVRAEILAGRLPTLAELLDGQPPLFGRLDADAQMWARSLIEITGVSANKRLRAALELLAASFTVRSIEAVRKALKPVDDDTLSVKESNEISDGKLRLALYSVLAKEWTHRDELVSILLDGRGDRPRRRALAAAIAGSSFRHVAAGSRGFDLNAEALIEFGQQILEADVQALQAEAAARKIKAGLADAPDADPDRIDQDDIDAMLEDRAELIRSALVVGEPIPPTVKVITVPPKERLTGHQRDAAKAFADISGQSLPLIEAEPATARRALVGRFPHAVDAIDTVLRDLSTSSIVKLRPVLLTGSPGCGKTALARALGRELGLYTTIYSCAGQADSSFMGTSSQWSTARPSVPLDAVRASETANPLVILDEIEKAGTSSHNGSLVNCLLTFLERGHASAIRDLALEVTVDLSWVNYIATANSLSGIQDPLRDRFRIIEVPDPNWDHVGDLARGILDDIAVERGIDRRWIPDLAADELEVLRKAWDGGSIRRLRRALDVFVGGRDLIMGRA